MLNIVNIMNVSFMNADQLPHTLKGATNKEFLSLFLQ